MRWTEDQLRAYELRQAPKHRSAMPEDAVEDESQLHREIVQECAHRGWMALHGSMAHKTFRVIGEPDFQILADKGRTFYLECKKKGSKPTKEQQLFLAWARKLGHVAEVVYSVGQVRDIFDGRQSTNNTQ